MGSTKPDGEMMRSQVSLRWADVARLLATWRSSSLALMAAAAILPGLSAASAWAYVAAAVVAGVVGLLLRPLMVELSARTGWAAVLPLALLGQAGSCMPRWRSSQAWSSCGHRTQRVTSVRLEAPAAES